MREICKTSTHFYQHYIKDLGKYVEAGSGHCIYPKRTFVKGDFTQKMKSPR